MTANRPPVYNGRYELRSQVARGGTAQVYLARDLLLDRPVALKVLFPELSTDHTFVERFRREAQAAANLSHPNIVPVFDWGESENTYFIVMEYVDGEPLASIIHSQAPLEPAQSAQVAGDIAKALSYAHRHGVVHRDVKPGNVLITADGQIKVTDFGIARAIGADEQITQTGLVMGTATYFSPEQAQGLEVDGRSDIYSLGVVLYEMVTGRPPFSGETPVSIAYQHVQEIPPRPRSLNPDAPPTLEAIVLQAMAKLPAERYQTTEDLRADLDRFLRNQTVLATPPSEFAAGMATGVLGRSGGDRAFDTTAVPATDYTPPKVRRTTPFWAGAAVVLVIGIVLAVIFGGRSLGYFGAAKFVKVPFLVGQRAGTAESKLKNAGFGYRVIPVKSPSVADSGNVLKQSPEFPASARAGSLVYLSVGGNIPERFVPSVTGLQKNVATQRLKGDKFTVLVTTVPFSVGQKPGVVTSESPSSGTKYAVGSTVTITVVGQPTSVPIPTWGPAESLSQAAVALTKAGFNLGATKMVFSDVVPVNDVVTSNPPPGTPKPQGTDVEITISRGAAIIVPNLIGDTAQQAQDALVQLGLEISIGAPQATSNQGLVGDVVFQMQSPGSQLASGNAVSVSLGTLAPGATTSTTTTTTTTTLPIIPPSTVPSGPPVA